MFLSRTLYKYLTSIYSNISIERNKSTGASVFRNMRTAFFWEKYKKFYRGISFLKYIKFSWGGLNNSISLNIRSFFRVPCSWNFPGFSFPEGIRNFPAVDFFYFWSLGWKVKRTGFHFWKYKKSFLFRKY